VPRRSQPGKQAGEARRPQRQVTLAQLAGSRTSIPERGRIDAISATDERAADAPSTPNNTAEDASARDDMAARYIY
jgi:hypothetical protein